MLAMAVAFTAFSLRAPFSGVGSLVSFIKADCSLSSGAAGIITTIPLVVFGVTAPLAGVIARKTGYITPVPVCFLLMLAGGAVRSYAGVAGLFMGTVMIGAGIGFLNVAMPVIIKSEGGGKVGLLMSIHTAAMTLMSAVSSGVSVGVANAAGGWKNSLAIFAAFPVIALAVWLMCARSLPDVRPESCGVRECRLFSKLNIGIAAVMGGQALLFFSLIAWLPSIAAGKGADSSAAAMLLLLMQVVGLLSNMAAPALIDKSRKKGNVMLLAGAIYIVGIVMLIFGPGGMAWLIASSSVLGLANGLSFTGALMYMTLAGKTKAESSALSAFSQSAGYLIAAPSPFILGAVYDAAGSWVIPGVLLVLCATAMGAVGKLAGDKIK